MSDREIEFPAAPAPAQMPPPRRSPAKKTRTQRSAERRQKWATVAAEVTHAEKAELEALAQRFGVSMSYLINSALVNAGYLAERPDPPPKLPPPRPKITPPYKHQ